MQVYGLRSAGRRFSLPRPPVSGLTTGHYSTPDDSHPILSNHPFGLAMVVEGCHRIANADSSTIGLHREFVHALGQELEGYRNLSDLFPSGAPAEDPVESVPGVVGRHPG